MLAHVRGRGPGFCFHQRAPCPQSGDAVRGPRERESPPPGLDMTVMKAVQVERTSPLMDEGRKLLFQRSDGMSGAVEFVQLCEGRQEDDRNPHAGTLWSQPSLTLACPLLSGRRVHRRLDIVCRRLAVYAPSDATMHGKLLVYSHPQRAATDQGTSLRGEGGSTAPPPGSVPVLARSVLQAVLRESGPELRAGGGGQRVGTMLPMLYPGITSHLQMSHKRNSTGYF
ncbi:unnamed protein product [Menidia menidia]|uniref:(Atlantic silverside) hypothetical protein n=1 Tax=Menidia menidia TaxID=238744 RepID=A0A8S4BRR7_9TELE|nr:unnamed protein product [Menidia menidia]